MGPVSTAQIRKWRLLAVFIALLVCLTGCTEEQQTSLGYAYVAPQTLTVRSQISAKSGSVTTLKHGDRVTILDVQRKMMKISASGGDGWVDSFDLLSTEQWHEIQHERDKQRILPSQGAATAFEVLNIHIEPSRRSPAFAQIPEGGPVEILGRTQAPKNAPTTKTSSLIVERPAPPRRPKKEQKAQSGFRPPSKPAPPKPPANWIELSAERIDASDTPREIEAGKKKPGPMVAAKKKAEPKKPVVMEDWTLVRTKKGDTGWVLTRNLLIAVPDEVAQYAEGKRITSYFELGSVTDEEKGVKHHWLWTTLSGSDPVDFDSWRVFIWNIRHHRYETSYRQRDLEGYFPVQVDPADGTAVGRMFHIVTKDDDGKFRRRTYSFDGSLVHLAGNEELPGPPSLMMTTQTKQAGGLDANSMESKAHPSWFRRQWSLLTSRFVGR